MTAFELAARAGADGIELDVRLDSNGEIVVLHDPTFERVTGGKDVRHVAEISYDEMRHIDVGAGERAPRLSEVLAFARKLGMRVNVEMKHDVPDRVALARATARQLLAIDPWLRIIVSSFDPITLAVFAALAPRIPRALLIHRSKWSRVALASGPVWRDAIHIERTITDAATVRRFQKYGLVVGVWTVNDTREALDLADLGVDILISDVPGRILGAFD